jgi:anthranilate synthase component I
LDFSTFEAWAKGAEVVPATRSVTLVAGSRTLPRALLSSDGAFVLESSGAGWEGDETALLGFRPRGAWRAWGHHVERVVDGTVTRAEVDHPLDDLRRYVRRRRPIEGLPRFSGGLVGTLSWGAVRWFEPKVALRLGNDPSFPDAEFLLVDDLAAVDWKTGQATLVTNVEPARFPTMKDAHAAAEARLDAIARELAEPALAADGPELSTLSVGAEVDTWGGAGYEAGVRAILGHVRAGDCMQVVLSRRLLAPFQGTSLALYERLHRASPVPFHFLVRFGAEGRSARSVVGASPELLIRVQGRRVTVRPIAGTRPRGGDEASDRALEAELRADPKERAEHVMLVDLGRNDVGRVAKPGTVRVEEREVVERFSHVMHLVSQVSGTLRDDMSSLDALAAAFPAGTVSGAPKVRAMQIIDDLEPVPRGPYGGCVGTVCYDGDLVMAIHLRSFSLAAGEVRMQAGAGIVYDSDPARELSETDAKLGAVRAAAVPSGT